MQPLNSEERYQNLAEKWLNGTITFEEEQEFSLWYNKNQDKELTLPESFAADDTELGARIYSAIQKQAFIPDRKLLLNFKLYAAAAVVLILIAASLYFYSDPLEKKDPRFVANPIQSKSVMPDAAKPVVKEDLSVPPGDIAPGIDKAILTLGDGTRIILDDAKNGVLASHGGNSILKTAQGELIYAFSSKNSAEESHARVYFNTIETPKGGKFQIKLPDGSKVWLNAASSLSFPENFKGDKRQVRLTGEAYFEVAHDSSRIFEVTAGNQTVQVLGTHFNINAYADEPSVNTTLLEGSVRISDLRTNMSQLLKPGEQAKLNKRIEVINIRDTGEAVAWKDGYFQFNEADIQTVMRQIERWYDVSVRYEGGVPQQRFGGEIERNLSLLQVLSILEKARVHFRVEGKEVVVMP